MVHCVDEVVFVGHLVFFPKTILFTKMSKSVRWQSTYLKAEIENFGFLQFCLNRGRIRIYINGTLVDGLVHENRQQSVSLAAADWTLTPVLFSYLSCTLWGKKNCTVLFLQ